MATTVEPEILSEEQGTAALLRLGDHLCYGLGDDERAALLDLCENVAELIEWRLDELRKLASGR